MIYKGTEQIKDIYIGGEKVKEIYKGSELVYRSATDIVVELKKGGGLIPVGDFTLEPNTNYYFTVIKSTGILMNAENGIGIFANTTGAINELNKETTTPLSSENGQFIVWANQEGTITIRARKE